MVGINNPFNIRWNPRNQWKGLSDNQVYKGFCNFISVEYGIRAAAFIIMHSYRKKGFKTYAQIIERFAPPSENNSSAYCDFVCTHLGVMPFDVPNTKVDFARLLHFMSEFEGNPVYTFVILDVIDNFKIKVYEGK